MRKIVLSLFLLLSIGAKSQWFSIPDTNFGTWLNTHGYTHCVQGSNQTGWEIDTLCLPAGNYLDCSNSNIHDLSGIKYIRGLDTLKCGNNPILTLPELPNKIRYLYCDSCQLTSITSLPDSLLAIFCKKNLLGILPNLPGNLKTIDATDNQLTTLPTLPSGLYNLFVSNNLLSSLPNLPNSITRIICQNNNLTALPALPSALVTLRCSNNQLTSLPAIPTSLVSLFCDRNQLTSLPPLPNLVLLSCGYNFLTSIPIYNGGIWGPTVISCNNNLLANLPPIPESLRELDCSSNQLTGIPTLPNGLDWLRCDSNINLQCLPKLPSSMVGLSFTGTSVSCLPNYPGVQFSYPSISTYSLCSSFNPDNCEVYSNISGKSYIDSTNYCYDSTDLPVRNIPVKLSFGGSLLQQTFTSREGFYSFDVSPPGSFEKNIDTLLIPFYVTCPSNNLLTDTLTISDSLSYNQDFGVRCKQSFDIGVWSILGGILRAATFTRINIQAGDIANFYGQHCALGVSGVVTITITGPVRYISPAPGALTPMANNNVLTYSISDFGTSNFLGDFDVILETDTTAVAGSQVCFSVTVSSTANDFNPTNNSLTHCFTVVSSHDPNNKQVYPSTNIDTSQKWLTFTINFQNTGNDTAKYIFITDTLDINLDHSTIQLLAYSHQPLVQIKGSAIRFSFPKIDLPDSNMNEQLSHGYVQYKVKLKDGLQIGTTINNTAFIYFDYNAPVITNTTSNTISISTAVSDNKSEVFNFNLFPNPAKNVLYVTVDESNFNGILTIYNITGQSVTSMHLTSQYSAINTEQFSDGVYITEIIFKNVRAKRKWVKM